jgi:transcriptional regulator with XRE-family HTH domain
MFRRFFGVGMKARPRQKKLPRKLKAIRTALGLTQGELLEEFGVDWIRQNSISDYENGRFEPPISLTILYARAANVCLDILLDDAYDLPETIPVKGKRHIPH